MAKCSDDGHKIESEYLRAERQRRQAAEGRFKPGAEFCKSPDMFDMPRQQQLVDQLQRQQRLHSEKGKTFPNLSKSEIDELLDHLHSPKQNQKLPET